MLYSATCILSNIRLARYVIKNPTVDHDYYTYYYTSFNS